jgi:hypothetical protein
MQEEAAVAFSKAISHTLLQELGKLFKKAHLDIQSPSQYSIRELKTKQV